MTDTDPSTLLPGLTAATIHENLSPARLVQHALANGEGELAAGGPLVVRTGAYTGRSPKDRFVVRNAASEDGVDWGEVNVPLASDAFERLLADMNDALAGRTVYRMTLAAGNDPAVRTPVTVLAEQAWHALFAHNLFLPGDPPTATADGAARDRDASEAAADRDGWTVLDLPSFRPDPDRHGSRGATIIALDFERRLVLIAGTYYGGEIKKSIFSALNHRLPAQDIFPMHCSANVGEDGRVALFFGLSGTGKTTLSADPERTLIGDDEHAWSANGVSNLEGGCYAKVIHLAAEHEPEIHAAATRFGTVLENVVIDERGVPDWEDGSLTENTRAAYPIDFVPGASATGRAGHPDRVLFLTADAFGVLPPLARLTREQAMAHFLCGYTAKVAGTERGVTEPVATFSACFAAPFLPRAATTYARMLGENLDRHGAQVWLVNTGWTGGRHGVGRRISLPHTRAMVRAILESDLEGVEMQSDPAFGLSVPREVPGVPSELLRPRDTWSDPAAYDARAAELARMFRENLARVAPDAPTEVRAALPH